MKATELCYLSIAELAPLLAGRQLSPVELVTALLERTEHLEPTLNSYITLLRDEALEAARQTERELAAGEPKGPLHGIPIALKDIIYTRGIRTTGGSKILADFVPHHDATCWTRLREAGAILMGKLNCHEFAWGATSVNPHYGDAHNPWDPSRITGGSSGGSGSAVASGEAVAALGTDTGGSIRMPGSLCGIVGLKPTYGRVSRFGVIPLSWSLDHIGPMCRTVEDCAIMLQALAGHDPRDPGSRNEPVPDYRQALTGDIAGLRIGVPREFFYDGLHPEVEQAVRQALKALEGLGARLEEVSTPWASQT
ncbi:MAG: amidase, partial [Dehalococcoidia bacterium]